MATFEITEPIARRRPRRQRALLLGSVACIVTVAQILFLVSNHSTTDIVGTIVAGAFLVWGAAYLWRMEEQPIIAFVEVTPDGLRIKDTEICDVFLPYPKIKSIRLKEAITFKDNLRDSFSWDGRSGIKGRHVMVACSRLVKGGRGLLLPTKVFRFKVDDPDALVALATGYKGRYRGLPT